MFQLSVVIVGEYQGSTYNPPFVRQAHPHASTAVFSMFAEGSGATPL